MKLGAVILLVVTLSVGWRVKSPLKEVLVRSRDDVVWSGFARRAATLKRKTMIVDNIESHSGLGRVEKDL